MQGSPNIGQHAYILTSPGFISHPYLTDTETWGGGALSNAWESKHWSTKYEKCVNPLENVKYCY